MRPLTIAPTIPSSRTARSSSAAAAPGSAVGSAANPAKRSGWAAIACATVSLNERATGIARGRLDVLEPGLRGREHLHGYAGGVHLGDPAGAEVREPRLERRRPAVHGVVGVDLLAQHLAQRGRQAVLLERDDPHQRFAARRRPGCRCSVPLAGV